MKAATKPRQVIPMKFLPYRYPFYQTATIGLLLDRIKAPGFVWGIMGAFMFVIWIAVFIDKQNEEEIDLFRQS